MDAMTELSITIDVEFERDKNGSAVEGHRTDSTAKKHPATAALKPIGQCRHIGSSNHELKNEVRKLF